MSNITIGLTIEIEYHEAITYKGKDLATAEALIKLAQQNQKLDES